jgi:hypothetical protein
MAPATRRTQRITPPPGPTNFYRRFIQRFSDIVRPLTDLTQKNQPWQWTPQAEEAFQRLKRIFLTEPALAQFDFEKVTRIETDSSGWCVGGTLQQANSDGLFIPCAFFSKKLLPAECNYEIYDKEMLAIIRCLEEWEPELQGVTEFEILSDHKNLEYFMTVQKLSERQIRWSLPFPGLTSKFDILVGRGTYSQMHSLGGTRTSPLIVKMTDSRNVTPSSFSPT